MILSKVDQFATALALSTAGAATILFGDVMDLGAGNRPLFDISHLYLVVQISTTVTSGGAATIQFQLASDAQAAIAIDGSATIHWMSNALPKATLVAGYIVGIIAMPKMPIYERYLGILTVIGTAALTAGNASAFLVENPSNWVAMADGNQ